MSEHVTTLSGHQRQIPATMATQHPDNARKPHWSRRNDAKVTLEMEGQEAYQNFSRLGIEETMWDNEGKHVDYSIGLKLVETYTNFFSQNQIGDKTFITYRIPNRWKQRGGIYRHSLTAVAAENETLQYYGFHCPAFFEVILPFTDNPYQLVGVQYDYLANTSFERIPKFLELIPLIEGAARLSDIQTILGGYLQAMQTIWETRLSYLRPFIARSDPALDSGHVAADLFALGGGSECYKFGGANRVAVFPIVGAGSARFRGGLTPWSVQDFVSKYPGFRTATVQSAFRYDYPDEDVKSGVAQLRELLPTSEPRVFDGTESRGISELIEVFTAPYKATITRKEAGQMPIVDAVTTIADKIIPSHRDRAGHVGYFGYSRDIGSGAEVELPRAIKFVAAFMTLGIPPELIGTGRGLHEAKQRGLLPLLERVLPQLREDLAKALGYLNHGVLAHLARHSEVWASIVEDVQMIEAYTGVRAGPQSEEEMAHSSCTDMFYELYRAKDGRSDRQAGAEDYALQAAQVRRYLG